MLLNIDNFSTIEITQLCIYLQLLLYMYKSQLTDILTTTGVPKHIKVELLQSVMVLLVTVNINETLVICRYLQIMNGHMVLNKVDSKLNLSLMYYIVK